MLCFGEYQSKVLVMEREDKWAGYFGLRSDLLPVCPSLCVCVCVRARARLRACMCDLRKGRKSNWGAGFDCSTSIVDPCILLLNSHSSYTHTHTHTNTRLIDQIDLHMSDGANFSPFPPLANLWPLIYTRLNLYTLIMLLCSLALSLFTHARSQVFCVVYNAAHWHMPLLSQHKWREESTRSCWRTREVYVTLMKWQHMHIITMEHSPVCEHTQITVTMMGWYNCRGQRSKSNIEQRFLSWGDFSDSSTESRHLVFILVLLVSKWFFYSLLRSLYSTVLFVNDFPSLCSVLLGASHCSADSQVIGESERSREQILQTLSDLSRGFQDIADRCLLVLHLEVRYAEQKTPLTLNRTENTHVLVMLLFHFEVTVSLIFLWQNHFESLNVNGKE